MRIIYLSLFHRFQGESKIGPLNERENGKTETKYSRRVRLGYDDVFVIRAQLGGEDFRSAPYAQVSLGRTDGERTGRHMGPDVLVDDLYRRADHIVSEAYQAAVRETSIITRRGMLDCCVRN
ncbi:hypothetical protein HHI36_023760 [Cryptolaemus montrouzieri]|uniref:Uncharacterized protein n=1 Tax=Cryptolaemus montrouzieri TaxID=559131 RepID=A0ABD2PHE2_9CUCU